MDSQDLRSLLKRIRGIHHACDLDLLLFFYRHPTTLLTSEELIAFVGYRAEQIAKSLDGLIDAGLLMRTQNPSRAARLYVLDLTAASAGGGLSSLLKIAATPEGRKDVMRLLKSDRAPAADLPRSALISKIA